MTIGDFLAIILLSAGGAMIWGSLQTVEGDSRKAYKKEKEDLWVETKVPGGRKPRFPNLLEPVLSAKKEKPVTPPKKKD
ncbi:hypothetical protein [Allocoleopsis sp.]|uniref:hypothetical protein n=1 Tax=Allocoleopsis sp. TaxID=3088169 RepID=UPI002FD47D61